MDLGLAGKTAIVTAVIRNRQGHLFHLANEARSGGADLYKDRAEALRTRSANGCKGHGIGGCLLRFRCERMMETVVKEWADGCSVNNAGIILQAQQ